MKAAAASGEKRYSPVTSVFRRLRQEDQELEASLGYRGRPCLKNITRNLNPNKT